MLQLNAKLKALIDKLWDRFWAGGISNPLSAIEQITYLLFMKQLDELDRKREKEVELVGDTFSSRFKGDYFLPHDRDKANELAKPRKNETTKERKSREQERKKLAIDKATLRWSHFKGMKSQLMLPHVQQFVFPFIKDLNGDGTTFTRHMANAVFLIPSANLLQGAIAIIEEIFLEIDRDAREEGHLFQDIQGDVYEMLLNEISSAGKNGQFRTPRHIIKLITELVDPQLGDAICDPACGTAGFLLDAYQYIITQLARRHAVDGGTFTPDEDGFIRSSGGGLLAQDKMEILEQNLHGYDFDTTMVRLALMNLMMHGIDNPLVDYQDTLSKSFTEENKYRIIMANPPFTGSIDKGDINESLRLNTSKTELLFIERILTLLTIDGTAGVIIPHGVLFGSGGAFVEARRKLVEETELKAVISLPSGVFKPYAGVATAILIFTRGGKTEHTWFYQLDNDGFSLDDKRQRINGSELPSLLEHWKARNSQQPGNRKSKQFFVPVQEIREKQFDLSFNRYHEARLDETVYEAPKAILQKLAILEGKIQLGLAELEGIIK
jgi:type I restriction enzyme M protein